MLEIIKQEGFDLLVNVEKIHPKYNKIWGADYMLMDSANLMGDIGGEGYEKIIDMFMNIWNNFMPI